MVTPNNTNIEKRVLAAMIRNGNLYDVAVSRSISAESFFASEHRRIFEAMQHLRQQGKTIDITTLAAEIPDSIVLLAELESETIAHNINFAQWLNELTRIQAVRMIARQMPQVTQSLETRPFAPENIIKLLKSAALDAEQLILTGQEPNTREVIESVKNNIAQSQKVLPLFPKGTMGAGDVKLHPGEMLVIGGATGTGKTELAADFTKNLLLGGCNVLYVCMESSRNDILKRIAASFAGVAHYQIIDQPTAEQRNKFENALKQLERFTDNLFILGQDNGCITTDKIENTLNRCLFKAGRIDAVVIDFIQGIRPPASFHGKTRLEQMDYVVSAIHRLLCESRAAGIVLAQFNRSGQQSKERPDLTWLKDTSVLEQLAHTVAFLCVDPEKKNTNETFFYSRKARNQKQFEIILQHRAGGYHSYPRFPPGSNCRA